MRYRQNTKGDILYGPPVIMEMFLKKGIKGFCLLFSYIECNKIQL